MSSLASALHDTIDFKEEQREEADKIVRKVIEENLDNLLEEFDNFTSIFAALAQMIEDELTDLTTASAKGAAEIARKRVRS